MTTNGEWLDYLAQNAPDELAAWFDAERTESPTSDTMRNIGQVIENTVMRGVYGDTESENEDSREQLEEDIKRCLSDASFDELITEWLNRQAAITDAEWNDELEQLHMGYRPVIDELQAQVDELTAERVKLRSQICKLEDDLVRTSDERDNWKANCEDWKKDCERYRSKFGKCLDYADAIHALMDDEGMA